MTPALILRLVRGFDGIFYALVVTLLLVVIIFLPSISINQYGLYDMLCLIPLAAVIGFSFLLPSGFSEVDAWPRRILMLRTCAVGMLGFAPFLLWWLSDTGSVYMTVNAAAAFLSLIGYLSLTNLLILDLAGYLGHQDIRFEAGLTLHLYKVLALLLAGVLLLWGGASWFYGFNAIYLLLRWFTNTSAEVCVALICLLALPFIFSMSLLLRIRILLCQRFLQVVHEYSAPMQAEAPVKTPPVDAASDEPIQQPHERREEALLKE